MNLSKQKARENITQGPIFGGMIAFALPLILSNLLNRTFNTADTMMVGRWGGATEEACEMALAAVGSCGTLITTIIALFSGLTTGTSVCVARELGAKDDAEVEKTVRTSVSISLLCGLICTAVGFFGARPLLLLMGTDAAVLEDAILYMRAYFLGIPANMVYCFCAAILTSSGDSVRPLAFLSVSGVINVGLNAVFIIALGMGAMGVGLATAISQWVALGMILTYMSFLKGPCRIPWRTLGIDRKKLKQLLSIGVPASVQGALFSFSNVFTQTAVNSFGHVMVAGNAAASNIETYLAVIQAGLATAGSVFVGQNVGARDVKRVKRVIIAAVALAGGVAVSTSVPFYFFAGSFISLFAPGNEAVIQAGLFRSSVVLLPYFLYGTMSVGTSILRGLGQNILPTGLVIGGCCVFRILWVRFVFEEFYSQNPYVLYLVYPVSWLLTCTAVYIGVFFVYRRWEARMRTTLVEA